MLKVWKLSAQYFKGTLMQVRQPLYMFVLIKYNTLKISYSQSYEFSSYLPVKFVFFLESRLFFNIFYCSCMFANKKNFSQTIRLNNSIILRIKNVKLSGYYFFMNTNTKGDFKSALVYLWYINVTFWKIDFQFQFWTWLQQKV